MTTAHRAIGNQEQDLANGKLAGYCAVCQIPWPCAYAGSAPVAAMREVVGVMVGTIIYPHICAGEPITRARMQFMACLDLGPAWAQWATAPTLFVLPEEK